MKRLTLDVEMRCNQACIFCGHRAVDPAVAKLREAHGLTVPRPSVIVRSGRIAAWLHEGLARIRGLPPGAHQARSDHGGFSRGAAIATIRRARSEGYDTLSLQGGEPTIWPWLPELVERARSLGYGEVTVVTNGKRLAEQRAGEALYEAGLTHVVFSLIGADASSQNELAMRTGSFESVLAAMDHAAAWSAAHPGRLHVSCNVVVHAENLEALPEMVALLADHGVEAATLHLVRFDLFGNDPTVRARLRFGLGRLTGPLSRAVSVARRRGIGLHAEDVPLCQHAHLRAEDLERVLARDETEAIHAEAPHQTYSGRDRPFLPTPCTGCIVRRHCWRAPTEHLDTEGTVLVPIDADGLVARLDAHEGMGEDARHDLEETAGAVAVLAERGLLGDEETARVVEAIRRAFGRLVEDAARSGDEAEAITAFYGLLGLHPPREMGGVEGLLAAGEAPRHQGDIGYVAPSGEPEAGRRRVTLAFAPGFEITFDGKGDEGGLELARVYPRRPPEEAPGGAPGRVVFLREICARVRDARRLRWTPERVEIDAGNGFVPAWSRATPWAVTWPG